MAIFSALLLSATLAIDTLTASFAYGTSNTVVPMRKLITIDLFGTILLSLSLFLGLYISNYISQSVTIAISAAIIIVVGIYKLIGHFRKSSEGIASTPHEIKWLETIFLAFILSIDNIAIGIGISIHDASLTFCLSLLVFTLIIDFVFFILGHRIGKKITKKTRLDLSWLSGLVLIILGVTKLL